MELLDRILENSMDRKAGQAIVHSATNTFTFTTGVQGKLVILMVHDVVLASQIHGHHKDLILQAVGTEEKFSHRIH